MPCRVLHRNESVNGHSKQSRISEATTTVMLEVQNGTVINGVEGPQPCCADNCCNCLPSVSQLNCCQKLRGICYSLTVNVFFEIFTIIMIVLTVVILALEDFYSQENQSLMGFLSFTNQFIPIVFLIEMIIRLTGRGCNDYFKSGWRTFDFIIVMLSLFNFLTLAGMTTIYFFRSLLAARLFRILTLTWKFESARVVFNTIFESTPGIINVSVIAFMEWVLFSIIGVQLFAGKFLYCMDEFGERVNATIVPDLNACFEKNFTWANSVINFDNNLNSFLALTQIATFKGWVSIIHDAVDSVGVHQQPQLEINFNMFIYFVLFTIFVSFYIYILWFSTIIDGFNRQRERNASHKKLSGPGDFIYQSAMKNLASAKLQDNKQVTNSKLQDIFQRFTNSLTFDIFIAVLIILNIIKLACHTNNGGGGDSTILLTLDVLFVVVYAVELILRLVAARLSFFKNWINVLDVLAVFLALISVSSGDVISNYIIAPMLLRLVRLINIIYKRKWTRRFTGFNCIMSSLVKTIPYLLVVCAILGVVIIIYAIIGMFFFNNIQNNAYSSDFETFGNALCVLLQIMVSAGWDGYLYMMFDQEHCYDDGDGCANPLVSVLYCITFMLVTYGTIFTTLTVIILEVYNETRAERKLLALLTEASDGFYQLWSQHDPTITGYIQLSELPSFLEMQAESFRVSQPNDAQIAQMDIPIVKGDKVHHRDVLDALYRNVLTKEGKPVSGIDSFEALPNTENDYEPISSTLWRKRETTCARIIQKTWSKHKKQTRI